MPSTPMAPSSAAYTRSGWWRGEITRESPRLPMHMPPMKVPSSTPSETADDPMLSERSWNQTIS